MESQFLEINNSLTLGELEARHLLACIVIPTYNEAENITEILERVFQNEYDNKESGIKVNVLVVDDSSPDGTADIVREYQRKNSDGEKVHLVVRGEKKGLGAAYIHGMKHALSEISPDVVIEMDADGQHNPDDLFRMLAEIENGADFVIGSRYVDGGSVPKDWGIHRKFISFCAGQVIKKGLGLNGVRDCSGGFRAIKKEVLESIDLDSLNVKGYAFQAALLEAAVYKGFNVKEIPIHFSERLHGETKMRFYDMLEGWKLIYHIRKNRLKNLFTGAPLVVQKKLHNIEK